MSDIHALAVSLREQGHVYYAAQDWKNALMCYEKSMLEERQAELLPVIRQLKGLLSLSYSLDVGETLEQQIAHVKDLYDVQ